MPEPVARFAECNSSSLRFPQGNSTDFHYKNLSGGEKAAFDVLLDVFLKRRGEKALFRIDEPEVHVATGLQKDHMIASSPPRSSGDVDMLWIATHSIGVVRQA